ncbi:MAG: hypothetical protein V1678_03615 [Candidatus Aenigmatarchaeota archaeon]
MNFRYTIEVGRKKIVSLLKTEAKRGHYPGRHEIQEKLGIWFYSYFDDMKEPYNLAGIDISKLRFNPFIATEKEKRLNEVSSALLGRMGFTIIESYRRDGADILVRDTNGKIIPIELKAYHRNSNVPISIVFSKKYENEVQQLEDYIKKCRAPYGILITTTNRIRLKMPPNIELIDGHKIECLLNKHELSKYISTIRWIRNTYSSYDRKVHEDAIKKKMLRYIRFCNSRGIKFSMRDLNKRFKLNIQTYFHNMLEIYKIAGISPPLRLLPIQEARSNLADFIRLKVKTGKYPSLEEIESKFNIHLKSYFKDAKEMYEYSDVNVPCKHLSKKDASEIILKYCKNQASGGNIPTIHRLDKKFHICVYSYFKTSKELHKLVDM